MIQDQQLDSVVLTIPASYKGTGQNLMKQAAQAAGFREVTLLAEPVAAAMYYSHQNEHLPISNGDIILVYDLGGGTFDAALIQKQSQGFELIALPIGNEMVGGLNFDRAILRHLMTTRGHELKAAI
jgi:molecular chaperone DnaK